MPLASPRSRFPQRGLLANLADDRYCPIITFHKMFPSSVAGCAQTAFCGTKSALMKSTPVTTTWVTRTLIALNAVGAIAYLILASRTWWVIPQERSARIHSVTGEPFVWAIATTEFLLPFVVLNLSWAAFVILRKHPRSARMMLLTPLIWTAAVLIDFAHH